MSSVLARFRGTTDCQCLTDARRLRGELLNWCFKEENIPKKYRNSFIPIIKEITSKIVNASDKAQRSYPTSPEKLSERKVYIRIAMDSCQDLWKELQCLDDLRSNSGGLNLTKFEPILTKLYNLQASLKSWESNSILQESKY